MVRSARGALVIALCAIGCGGGVEEQTGGEVAAAPSDSLSAAASAAPPAAAAGDTPDEVYFDLTRFDWYRRAEPLVHEGRAYRAAGDPVVASVDALRELGRYQGVAYYAQQDAPPPVYTLYVPVYYRYWQRFISPPGGGTGATDSVATAS